ncbi:MAG: multiheme c-type cytochrome [Vicinamibacteria bacterium]
MALVAARSQDAEASSDKEGAVKRHYTMAPSAPEHQTEEEAFGKSVGCVSCHTSSGHKTMHENPGVVIGCIDCHGGDPKVMNPGETPVVAQNAGRAALSAYAEARDAAHILPDDPKAWRNGSSGNPQASYTLLNRESSEFIRFMNPGDLRVARLACGSCHLPIVQASERSLMSTSAMFWAAAAYNNGILPFKHATMGEAYTQNGAPAMLRNPIDPSPELAAKGIVASLFPLPAWETVPPADVFRVFERGGRVISSQFPEIGLPNNTGALQKLDEPGRPDLKQSNRGPGTGSRVSIPVLNMTKTRLNDPHLWFLGTNDQPGDYRSSGCTACHTVYANDRDPKHSGPYAVFGNRGESQNDDPTIPREKSGHPLEHKFTRAIPSSQCMTCHMHQPNIFVNTFYGYTMWDYESDAPTMWPEKQKYPTAKEARAILDRNPEGASIRGKWSDPEFLRDVSTLNAKLKDTQFADYHGHGWNFRAVYKRDRKGTLLDALGKAVSDDDPAKFQKAVHLASIHMEKGMQCVDCHFAQDAHGNGHIYGEVPAAIEVDCRDCHGTASAYPTLFTSGPAASPAGRDMKLMRTQDGRRRFEWREGKLYQRSAVDPDLEWEMHLVKDSVNPLHPNYNAKAARAKTMSVGLSQNWGAGIPSSSYAHSDEKMACFSCHTSWTTTCAGCHLPIEANWKTERKHYEGGETRNFATYNPQVARDDAFQLGRQGSVKGGRIAPVRSSSALVLSSTNINRERIYVQQPPISASGYSSQAFAPHYPHTERTTETKTCTDCHVSENGDNNAIMAQLLLQGTNFLNFVGLNAYVGSTGHVTGVRVTEWDEPQTVIGSYLQRYAYPDYFAKHQKRGQKLDESHSHGTSGPASCLQLRGEYLYVAEGSGGFRVYDVASIANKGVSQRIITAPFSSLGQNAHVSSTNATCMALPTNQPIAPMRDTGDLMRVTNQEQPMHPIYNYAFVVDAVEGLILVNINTFADLEPRNNNIKRALTWNEGGVLKGASHITIGGHYLYIAADRGIVVVNVDDPLKPRVASVVEMAGARATALQFRYLFVTDATGLRVVDVTVPEKARLLHPEAPAIPLADAHRVYVARTYAYVAAGKDGLAIVDVERPEAPKLLQNFTAGGVINDARDVVIASTNASLFAYVADGRNGLRVVQLTSPSSQPKFYGFSPEPKPQLIASRQTETPALALSKGLDRDRAVDETGGQIAVMGRIGARPFTRTEMEKMYLGPDGTPWTVTDRVDVSKFRGTASQPDQRGQR